MPLALVAAPAQAHGGLSSLAGLRVLLFAAVGVFFLVWGLAWLVLKAVARARRKARGEPAQPYWMRDKRIPRGLRLLALAQYLLAFLYALSGLTTILFTRPLRPTTVYFILFSVVFAVLAIWSANGYLRGLVGRGFRCGILLGWTCVICAGLSLVLAGPGLDLVGLVFGAVLLVSLNWRYRPYFGVGPWPGA